MRDRASGPTEKLDSGIQALGEAAFGGRDGLSMQLGGSEDKKGGDDVNDLSDVAWAAKFRITKETCLVLEAVSLEEKKPPQRVRRRGRLGTLVNPGERSWQSMAYGGAFSRDND